MQDNVLRAGICMCHVTQNRCFYSQSGRWTLLGINTNFEATCNKHSQDHLRTCWKPFINTRYFTSLGQNISSIEEPLRGRWKKVNKNLSIKKHGRQRNLQVSLFLFRITWKSVSILECDTELHEHISTIFQLSFPDKEWIWYTNSCPAECQNTMLAHPGLIKAWSFNISLPISFYFQGHSIFMTFV